MVFELVGVGHRAAIAPADFVALGSGAQFADFALVGRFKGAAATHLLEDAFGIEFRLEALERAVNRFAFFYINSSHAIGILMVVWFRMIRGAAW